jgi:hypothetical protein
MDWDKGLGERLIQERRDLTEAEVKALVDAWHAAWANNEHVPYSSRPRTIQLADRRGIVLQAFHFQKGYPRTEKYRPINRRQSALPWYIVLAFLIVYLFLRFVVWLG